MESKRKALSNERAFSCVLDEAYEVAFRGFCTSRFGVAIPVPTPVEQV
jgi:hypothetical protein